ncbi:MAG: hypothetical protein AB7T19_13260, partial [Planctomycetota bacterium]
MREQLPSDSGSGRALLTLAVFAIGSTAACEGRLPPIQDPEGIASTAAGQESIPIGSLPILRDDSRGFPARLAIDSRELQLNGDGLCEWGIFGIDLYRAALYTERPCRTLVEAMQPPQIIVIHL